MFERILIKLSVVMEVNYRFKLLMLDLMLSDGFMILRIESIASG